MLLEWSAASENEDIDRLYRCLARRLEHIVRVAFFMHNVADNRFQSSAMPRIKFIQRLGPMFRDCFHERLVDSHVPCPVARRMNEAATGERTAFGER